jgi:nitronate monooxygenase
VAARAFLLCDECTVTGAHRAALRSDAARVTTLTNLFTGRPSRGIVNRLMREIGPLNAAVPRFPLATAAIAPLRARAEATGSGDFSPLWAGQNVSGCRDVPAGQLVRELGAALRARIGATG